MPANEKHGYERAAKSMVSVIIPTYNRAWILHRAISSVLEQSFTQLELLVVDDGSSDATEDLVGGFKDKRIKYFYQENKGVASARNLGLKKAKGRYAAFLDSDDYWLPEKLQVQLRFMCDTDFCISQTSEIWMRKGSRVNPMNKHQKQAGWIFEKSLPLCLVSPSCTVMDMALAEKGFIFNEGLLACEDYDLWLRISLEYPFGLLPQAMTVRNGGRPDQLSGSIIGLDLYRIYSLLDIRRHRRLSHEKLKSLDKVLGRKVALYCKGCAKRGKFEEAHRVRELFESRTCVS